MVSRRTLAGGAFGLACIEAADALPEEAPVYPRRDDLLSVVRADGVRAPVRTARDWTRRRTHILQNLHKVMGPFPGPEKRVPLDLQREQPVIQGSVERHRISFATEPGDRVPAWLLTPRGQRKRVPGVLCLHQTVRIGKDEPAGLGGSNNLQYARELAERGYVTLAPDYVNFGEHTFDGYGHGWKSGSLKAVWDNRRAVDLLQSLREVDPDRIGCIGHSLGGHNTLFTSAFDPRISAAVTNCGFTAFSHYYGGNITGWSGPTYMPRIKSTFPTPDRMPFDFHDVLAAIAPRAVLAIAPLHDSNFDNPGVRLVIDAVRRVYEFLGHPDRLDASYPDCAHDWPRPERERAYAWFDRWLDHHG